MRICIKKGNVSQGVWVDLPASQDEVGRIYTELEGTHSSGMIPFVAGVGSGVPSLAECLGDCAVFTSGHIELLNELARETIVWGKDEKARFGAALMRDHPDTIGTVMDVAGNLGCYILDDRIKSWETTGRLKLERRGIQIDKKIEPFLDLESIGREYIYTKGHITPMGHVTEKQSVPYSSKGQGYEPHKECLLSIHMTDKKWNKEIFQLPLTE